MVENSRIEMRMKSTSDFASNPQNRAKSLAHVGNRPLKNTGREGMVWRRHIFGISNKNRISVWPGTLCGGERGGKAWSDGVTSSEY